MCNTTYLSLMKHSGVTYLMFRLLLVSRRKKSPAVFATWNVVDGHVGLNNQGPLQENEVIAVQDTPPNAGPSLKTSTPAMVQDTDSETSHSELVTGHNPPVPVAGLTSEPRIGQLLKEGQFTSV